MPHMNFCDQEPQVNIIPHNKKNHPKFPNDKGLIEWMTGPGPNISSIIIIIINTCTLDAMIHT